MLKTKLVVCVLDELHELKKCFYVGMLDELLYREQLAEQWNVLS